MPPYYSDTHPKMEALQVLLLRSAPPWRKMEMLAALNASARALALAGLRQRYPQAGEAELATAWLTCCWDLNWRVRFMVS